MTHLQQEIYDEAIRIADEIYNKAKKEGGNYYWETLQSDLNQNTSWEFSENLYNGSSGVALFLLELYTITQNETYLDFSISHSEYLKDYCKKNKASSWAFVTGRTGVSYYFLRLYEITGKNNFLTTASEIVENCIDMVKSPYLIDDYINGVSGTLTYLLKLYHYTHEDHLVNTISIFSEHLLKQASLGQKGLYWDRSEKQKFGLCGFSHGVSGVAFSYFELAKATGNDAFIWLAEYALQYEEYHYNKEKLNWPDFRHGIYKEEDYVEHKEKYLQNDIEYFISGGDMNAWCHGAMGIGLTRKRAFELSQKQNYRDQLDVCVEKTKTTTNVNHTNYKQSFTLCHGAGGNADVYLQAYLLTKENRYLNLAEEVAQLSLNSYKEHKIYYSGLSYSKEEDLSLFMGTAGVGYFYLRTLFPDKIPSILALEYTHDSKVPSNNFLKVSKKQLLERLIKKDFPISSMSIDVDPLLVEKDFPSRQEIYNFVKANTTSVTFNLEEIKYLLEQQAISASHLNISELVEQENGRNFIENNGEIKTTELQLTDRIKLITNEQDENIMLTSTALGVTEQQLSPFSYVVLASFEEKNKIDSILDDIYEMFDSTSDEEKNQIQTAVIEQIESAIKGGILLVY